MGLLHSMFGGGTSLEIQLDNDTAAPGAAFGGHLVVGGGKKPLRLTELSVKLFSVTTRAREGQANPELELHEGAKQVVVGGIDLAPNTQTPFTFRIAVPHDAPVTEADRTFKLVATADIPGVTDPTAEAVVHIVGTGNVTHTHLAFHEILARFPGLQSDEEEELCKGLHEFFVACYSEGAHLMEAEPIIGHHMTRGTVRVRREALRAWANLVDNRVQPQHLQTLDALANTPDLDDETFTEVVIAATKFAEEGSLALVQHFAQHPNARVRADVSSNLRFNAAEKFEGKRELLIQLAQDPAPEVRKGAVSALATYGDDPEIVNWVAQIADADASPEVQAECMSTLQLAHHHGMLELALSVYERHLQNPHPQVRKEIARALGSLPPQALQRISAIVQRLAQDPDEEVRDAIAFQFYNMSAMPQLLPIAQHMAQNDPSPQVRQQALGSMASLMQPHDAAAFYGQLLQQARSESDLWPIVKALRPHRDYAEVHRILTHLGQLPYPDIANAAREALS